MLSGIDHVLIACADPDAAADEIEAAVGLRASAGGRHEVPGTFNRLIWLGDSYIELLGIWDSERAARWWWGQVALAVLGGAAAKGEQAGYMGFVLASDDLAADVAALRARGSVLGEPEAGERRRPDGRSVRWWSAREPAPDPDAGLMFLIEHDSSGAEWSPEERAERSALEHPLGGPARLERLELPVSAMQQATMRLHRDVGVAFRPSLAGGGARDGAVGRQTVRLVPAGQADGARIVIRGGTAQRDVRALSCRWLVEPAELR